MTKSTKKINSENARKKEEFLSNETRKELFAALEGCETNFAVNASFTGAHALQRYVGGEEVDYWKLTLSLDKQIKSVNNGDLKAIEGVLTAQIHILNNMFNDLARKAINQKQINFMESFMRLAFKAQNQCRVTIETLAQLKNPTPATFVKQANIGYNQQVNNTSPDAI